MAALDLRGRVIITNGASGTLNTIRRDLSAIGQMSKKTTLGNFTANALNSTAVAAQKLDRILVGLRGKMLGAGFALGGIIATTRDFNESKFGYGFARITDYIKDGKLQLDDWKRAMDAAGKSARDSAQALGTTPEITMRAKEEVEKLGFTGKDSSALYDAALGLHLSEPRALDAGDAAKFIGRVYAAYEKQRGEQAKAQGVDPNDPAFVAQYMKSLAAKTAVAAAASPLGPADTVEGMRQFAAQWASMGIPFEFALAMLAHSSKYGFEAPELGTAFKSMANKVLNPTPTAMRLLDARGIDRAKYMDMEAGDPVKAVSRLNSLLDGALFAGKDGKTRRANWVAQIKKMREDGTLDTPEGQQKLTNAAMKVLGKGWAGKQDDVRQAISNAVLMPTGTVDMPGYLKALKEAGLTIGEIAQVFEGRHIARNSPTFQFYEKLIEMYDQLKSVDGSVIDAVTQGRKESEAGKTDSLIGAWQNLVGAMEDTGVITVFKDALTGLANALRGMPTGAVQAFTWALVGLGGAALTLTALGRALALLRGAAGLLGFGRAAAGAAGGIGAAEVLGAGAAGMTAKQAASALGRMGSLTASGRMIAGMSGAGAAAGGAASRLGVLGRLGSRFGLRFIPGLGLVIVAGGALMAAGNAYAAGEDATGIAKHAAMGAIGVDGLFDGGASSAAPDVPSGLPTDGDAASQAGGPAANAQAAADQIRAIFAGIDLTAEGQRIMESLAAGITAGGASAISAAQNVAAGVRAAGSRVPLNTGPNMQGD